MELGPLCEEEVAEEREYCSYCGESIPNCENFSWWAWENVCAESICQETLDGQDYLEDVADAVKSSDLAALKRTLDAQDACVVKEKPFKPSAAARWLCSIWE
jgi:hypothetical protein